MLRVIAAERGLSSRQVGERAGVGDRGQLSRLLNRLVQLGLVRGGRAQGASRRSWELTAHGWQVVQAADRAQGEVSRGPEPLAAPREKGLN